MATILIVDDREANRDLLVSLLGYGGHRLLQAMDGEEGIRIARAERPDLIITDIVMPKMDGYEFARQIRADPLIGQTQIIFCTSSYILEETRRLADACGVSIVISKPIEPESFLQNVAQALVMEETRMTAPESADFYREHMRLLTDTLARKVDELEAEVHERKASEAALHESQRQMTALVTSLDDIIFEFDGQGTYLNVWAHDETLLARPKSELIGRRIDEILGEEQAHMFVEACKRVLASGKSEDLEYSLDVLGGRRWFLARISPIVSIDGPLGSVSMMIRDITERHKSQDRIQHQLQKLRALRAIDMAISNTFDMKLSLSAVLREVLAQLHADAADVMLLNHASLMLEYAAGMGFRSARVQKMQQKVGEGHAGRVALERHMVRVADLRQTGAAFLRGQLLAGEEFVAYHGVPLIAKGELKGVLEVFHRSTIEPDHEWQDFLDTLAGQAAIAVDNGQLFERLQRSNTDLSVAYDATIEGWSRAMDLRDKEAEGHTRRVTEMTIEMARATGMTEEELVHVRRGALLHDMGKMGLPDSILLKTTELSDAEWALMRKHPEYAFEMLSPIAYLRQALPIPYCHHEHWDGTGYPRGLKGEEIPLAARLFAVADVWDTLRSDRPHRKGWDSEKTLAYMIEQSGKHFDPKVVELFLRIIKA